MKFLIFFVLLQYVLGQQRTVPTLDGRIVGGTNADIANYPYQVSLQLLSSHICGGALISSTWVLTAAHCVDGVSLASFFSIRGGSSIRGSGGQVQSIIRVIIHANYSRTTLDFDVALLQLSSPVLMANAQAIRLPPPGTGPAVNSTAAVTGWGALSEGGPSATILQVVYVPIVSQADCRRAYSVSAITDRMLCAGFLNVGGRDACQGDSGGPLAVNGTLYGIVSWGEGCGRPEFPGVYANVGSVRSWIAQVSGI